MEFKLQSEYQPQGDQPDAIRALVDSVRKGNQKQTLLGVTGSGKTFTMANMIQELQRPALIISHNKTLAAQLYSEFKTFFQKMLLNILLVIMTTINPKPMCLPLILSSKKTHQSMKRLERLRLAATGSLISRNDVIVIASVSCIYGLGSPDDFRALSIEVRVGQELERDILLESLIDSLYNRNDVELKAGKFLRPGRCGRHLSCICQPTHKNRILGR